ncbi:phosphatase PAP2 family protein [Natrialbaceae archaeon A-arb3/5]
MSIVGVVSELALVVAIMLVSATLVVVGSRRLAAALGDIRWRFKACTMPLIALVIVLLIRWSTVDILTHLERRVLQNNITFTLFELEELLFPANPVVVLQAFQSPLLTDFFVFIYIYGYAFLLLFPFIAYFVLDDMADLRALILAFTANYGIGLICYVFFIAYGPRNLNPDLFEGLLYTAFPESRTLTNRVNQNTNVFPSLHTSLSMTVFFFAWITRRKYPVWVVLSGALALSVALSTMYLGIHWFSDVVAGTILALLSVYIGYNRTLRTIPNTVYVYLTAQFDRIDRAND